MDPMGRGGLRCGQGLELGECDVPAERKGEDELTNDTQDG